MDARYASAAEMGSDLRAFLEGRRTTATAVVSAATADERLLAIGLASGTISILDARTGNVLVTFERGSSPVRSLRFRMPDGLPSSGETAGRASCGFHCKHQAPTTEGFAAFFIVRASRP